MRLFFSRNFDST